MAEPVCNILGKMSVKLCVVSDKSTIPWDVYIELMIHAARSLVPQAGNYHTLLVAGPQPGFAAVVFIIRLVQKHFN